jgi:hypothetical protein
MTRNLLLTLFLLASALSGIAQTRSLKGVVTDGISKEPLAGVSILIAGTNTGSSTDAEGKFVLNVPSVVAVTSLLAMLVLSNKPLKSVIVLPWKSRWNPM